MSKFIDIVFTAPPSMAAPQWLQSQDEAGTVLDTVGQWLAPDDDVPFWRLRYNVAELLALLIAGSALPNITTETQRSISHTPPLKDNIQYRSPLLDNGIAGRRALKDKIDAGRPPRPPRPAPSAPPAPIEGTETGAAVDADEDMAEALRATPEDGGFDPSAVPEGVAERRARARADALEGTTAPPFAQRLFDGVHHGKGGDSAPDDDDDEK